MQEFSPRAERIYVLLRSAIEAGEYEEGAALPSQVELARRLGASVATLRKALERLAQDGYVEARHGSGTYVRSRQPIRGRVLVVDDDPSLQRMMRGLLRDLGFEADVVTSGEEAIAEVVRRHYTHVLMDVRMEGMGGLAAASKIHQIDPSVVVVFMTGHPLDILESDRTGVWPALVLRKPFDISELERTLSVRVV